MTTEPPRQKRTRNSNGESSIYEGTDGRWHGWITYGVKPDGSPDRRHRTGKNRKAVVAKIKDLERERDSGTNSPVGSATTVEEWLQHWIRNVAPMNLRRKSLASYSTDVHLHLIPGLGKHRLSRLAPAHVEAFYAAKARETTTRNGQVVRRYRPTTIDHIHRTLRSALRDAMRAGLVNSNAAAAANRRVDQSIDATAPRIEPFDIQAAQAIIAAASGRRNGVRFIVALSHGIRQGEALGLPWSDVRLDASRPSMTIRQQLQRHTWLHGCGELPDGSQACGRKRGTDCPRRHGGGLVLTQVKTRQGERHLGLDSVTADLLRAHRDAQATEREDAGSLWTETGLVFTQENGRPIDPRADSRAWKQLLGDARVPEARLHDARHTAATLLLVQGVDPRVVMDLMGWSSTAMLQRYQHVIDDLRIDAAQRVASLLHPAPPAGSGPGGA